MRKFAAIFALGAVAAAGEIIDRIAVTIGNQVITASDIDREIRVSAFLDRRPPDFSPAVRRTTADRMVQQRLVRRELDLSKFPMPELSEAEAVLKKFRADEFPDDAAWKRALADAGVTENGVRDHILWQLTLLRFVDARFRPGVQISDEDVAEYFRKAIAPIARAASGGQEPSLDDYRERVTEILTQQRVDRDLDAWITESRKRAGVEYRKEVFGQ